MSDHACGVPGAAYTSPMTFTIRNMSTSQNDTDHQHGAVVEESRPELAKPPMFQVALLNDDLRDAILYRIDRAKLWAMSSPSGSKSLTTKITN